MHESKLCFCCCLYQEKSSSAHHKQCTRRINTFAFDNKNDIIISSIDLWRIKKKIRANHEAWLRCAASSLSSQLFRKKGESSRVSGFRVELLAVICFENYSGVFFCDFFFFFLLIRTFFFLLRVVDAC
jgi:hypothetical protein